MIAEKISRWLQDYLKTNNLKTFVVGVSGGIDSAVASTLCALTGAPTVTVNLPLHSSRHNTDLSNLHLEWLRSNYKNVQTDVVCLDSIFDSLTKALQQRVRLCQ